MLKKIALCVIVLSISLYSQETNTEAINERNKAVNEAAESLRLGMYEKSLELLVDYTNSLLSEKTAVYILAEANYALNNDNDAAFYYKTLLSFPLDKNEKYSAQNALANIYFRSENTKEGIEFYSKLSDESPSNSTIAFNLGVLYEKGGNKRGALEAYKRAFNANFSYTKAIRALLAIYDDLGKQQEAKDMLKEAYEKNPENEEIQQLYRRYVYFVNINKAEALFESGEYEKASSLYEEIIVADREAILPAFRLANIYYNIGLYKKAESILNSLAKKESIKSDNANSFQLYKLYTAIFYEMKEYEETIRSGSKALVYNREDSQVLDFMGRAYEETGEYNEALNYYRKAIEINSKAFTAFYRAALLETQKRNYKEASSLLKTALNNGYDNSRAKELYNDTTIAYLAEEGNSLFNLAKKEEEPVAKKNLLDKASAIYEKALSVERRSVILLSMANTKILLENYEEAEAFLKEVLEKDKENITAYFALSRLYTQTGRYDEKTATLAKIESLQSSKDLSVMFKIALAYEESGGEEDLNKASLAFKKLYNTEEYKEEAAKRLAMIRYNQGVRLFNGGDIDEAEKYFKIALQYNSSLIEAKAALEEIELARFRKNKKENIEKANAYFENGNYSDAIALYLEILKIDPSLTTISYNLSMAYYNKRKYLEAVSVLQGLSEKEPEESDFVKLMGKCYAKHGDISNAQFYYKKAISLDANNYEVYASLGDLYKSVDNLEDAIKYYQEAKRLGLYSDSNYNYAGIMLGNIYYASGDYDKALSEYEEVLAKDDKHAIANFNTSFIYYKKNKLDKAEETLEKARMGLSSHPLFHLNMAKILFYKDELNKAIEAAEEAYEKSKASFYVRKAADKLQYFWWYAKIKARVAGQSSDKNKIEEASTLLDACITNTIDNRIAYLGRVEKLGISPKPVTVFYNLEKTDKRTTPVWFEDKQFLQTQAGEIVCQDSQTEYEIWRRSELMPLSSSIIHAENLFYSLSDGSAICRETKNGELLWIVTNAATRILRAQSNTAYVLDRTDNLSAYKEGKALWSKTYGENEKDAFNMDLRMSIILYNKSKVYAIDKATGEIISEIEAERGENILAAYSAFGTIVIKEKRKDTTIGVYSNSSLTGEIEISAQNLKPLLSTTPIITTTSFIYASEKGYVVCVSPKEGKILWQTEVGNINSTIMLNGRVLVSSGKDIIMLSALNGEIIYRRKSPHNSEGFVSVYLLKPNFKQ